MTLATELGDQRRLVRALSFLVTALTLAGEYDEAIEFGHRTLAFGRAVDDPLLAVEMDYRFAQVYHALGEYRRAVDILRARMGVADSDQSRTAFSAVVFFRLYLGLSLAELGEFTEGIARLEEAAAAAQETKLAFDLAGADLGLLYVQRGDILQALPVLERAWDLCQTKNLQVFAPITGALLGLARCRSGALSDGVALLERCAEATQGAVPFRSQIFVCLGECYLLSDRTNDARRAAEQALTIARDHKGRGYEAWALHLLGYIAGQGMQT